jgi:hypothetical protein
MGLWSLFQDSVDDRTSIVSQYQRLRAAGLKLNNKLVSRLTREVMYEGGECLGMLRNNTLIFDTEDESCVLMDYCLYDVFRNGRNAIEQYLADSPPDPTSDEMACLQGMQTATYTIIVVESVERGVGVIVRDLRSDQCNLLVDMGLAGSAKPGLFIATRLLRHDTFWTTSGAALPLGLLPKRRAQEISQKMMQSMSIDEQGYCDPAPLIRACLERGSSSNVAYQELGAPPVKQLPTATSSTRIGRNSLCPCGSGKKFKQCCLRRPK